MAQFFYDFDWDPVKAHTNFKKHGVDFEMKPEYDFSKGQRGKFYRAGAAMRLPVYLDPDVQQYLADRAADKGVPLGEMVNALLKREIQIIESVK